MVTTRHISSVDFVLGRADDVPTLSRAEAWEVLASVTKRLEHAKLLTHIIGNRHMAYTGWHDDDITRYWAAIDSRPITDTRMREIHRIRLEDLQAVVFYLTEDGRWIRAHEDGGLLLSLDVLIDDNAVDLLAVHPGRSTCAYDLLDKLEECLKDEIKERRTRLGTFELELAGIIAIQKLIVGTIAH